MLPLRPGSVRAIAQSTVQRGAREGLSAARIFDALRSAGISYRRTDFLADVRFYTQRERRSDAISSVRRDRLPSEAIMSPARRHQSERYLYTVEVRTADDEEPVYRSIATSRRITRGEAEDLATEPSRRYGSWETRRDIQSATLRYVDRAS